MPGQKVREVVQSKMTFKGLGIRPKVGRILMLLDR